MNIQEPDKKLVYEILDTVTITKQHSDWLNWEVLRIGQLARQYADEGDLLRAEVERLTNNCNYLDQKLDEELDNSAMLCGQVERLTKAGDAMLLALNKPDDIFDNTDKNKSIANWQAAKEGKNK